jgi:hypothetical protein
MANETTQEPKKYDMRPETSVPESGISQRICQDGLLGVLLSVKETMTHDSERRPVAIFPAIPLVVYRPDVAEEQPWLRPCNGVKARDTGTRTPN